MSDMITNAVGVPLGVASAGGLMGGEFHFSEDGKPKMEDKQ